MHLEDAYFHETMTVETAQVSLPILNLYVGLCIIDIIDSDDLVVLEIGSEHLVEAHTAEFVDA